ncbi:polysaccharide biosynthesis tyrosine autokinase [Tsuneonella sp. YG55]|uniref:non-specific protein-tyrosine kinase n=1 Tax=Tsuneonella litorea TaxID=2976475 RepID=A0A9X2W0R3_9SPHN|nr:polysaccharide biosynthesis tyrosine autokinase [Tsuneonella litorea]MCT2557785.1 polysaccharide biosynthesis tyrosine autokinase [Tsuneonella litorea]
MTDLIAFPAANPLGLSDTGASGPKGAGETPAIERVWLALNKYRIDFAVIVVLALLGALLITLISTPKYTATSRIEISRQQDRVTNVEGLQPDTAGQDLEFYQTQYSLLEARSLAERVMRAERLASDDAFFAASGVDLDGEFSSAGSRSQREQLAVDLLMRNVSVEPVRNSALVDLRYTSSDPQMSARIANAWVAQFVEAKLARRFDSTSDAREFLTNRLAELRQKLEQSERDLVNYAAQKGILPIETTIDASGRTIGQRTIAADKLQGISEALAKATTERIEAQARLGGSGAANESGNAGGAALPGLRTRRAEVASEYAKLSAQFEDGYPPVQALRSQMRSLDEAIAREERRVGSGTREAYDQAVKRERELLTQANTLEANLFQQRSDSIQYNIYQREVDTNRELYDGLLQRYKEIGVAGVGSSNVAIVDRATVPEGPSSPNMRLNLALAVIFGLAAAMSYVFIREQIDQSISDPADVSGVLGLSLLGLVPRSEEENAFEALADRKSELSEAYSSIATSLSFLTDHGIPRSMMFTSTVANEGKSTSVYALAEIIARLGRSVVIVDADMRNPTAHIFYEVANQKGLSNYLSGNSDLSDLIAPTKGGRVSVLPAGPTPPSTLELLSSERMRTIVRELASRFDHVLVDSPPILGLADAPLISRVVEGAVLAVEADNLKARRIKDGIVRLESAQTHIFGAILTKVDRRSPVYGYGYGYGYGSDQNDPFKYGSSASG